MDVITKEEALQLLKEKESGKAEREAKVRELGCAYLRVQMKLLSDSLAVTQHT